MGFKVSATGAIEDGSGGPVELTKQRCSRMEVLYNQDGTPSITASLNVSSVDDDSTGVFTVHYTSDFDGTDYISAMSCMGATSSTYSTFMCSNAVANTVSAMECQVRHPNASLYDVDANQVISSGDLA